MAQLVGQDEIESIRIEPEDIGTSFRSSLRNLTSSFRRSSGLNSAEDDVENEYALLWAEIYRLPTFERLRLSLFDENVKAKLMSKGKG